ncbi:hypothetical protein KIW84_041624 [Lathyrus oleraceus]|uniref:Non-structural maintenance of chromosomes element 1 homolog n=1 Tax=Pisum sativum TaxID=3888 RepID=A0A9D4XAD9_PEA|nr:hypothetical protein KIW84_041624 [Pisum sativum]
MSGGLSPTHHVIVQALLSRGPLKEKDLHSMFEDLTKKSPGTDRRLFDAFILAINKALTCANFELRACIDQYDGHVYYGVVNTVSDEQSKLGTKYTVPQIAFYKAIMGLLSFQRANVIHVYKIIELKEDWSGIRDGGEISTRDWQKMVQALPQYTEQVEKISLHVELAKLSPDDMKVISNMQLLAGSSTKKASAAAGAFSEVQ